MDIQDGVLSESRKTRTLPMTRKGSSRARLASRYISRGFASPYARARSRATFPGVALRHTPVLDLALRVRGFRFAMRPRSSSRYVSGGFASLHPRLPSSTPPACWAHVGQSSQPSGVLSAHITPAPVIPREPFGRLESAGPIPRSGNIAAAAGIIVAQRIKLGWGG